MKRSILVFIFLSAIFFGCGSSSNTSSNTQNPHVAPHQEVHDQLIKEETKNDQKEIEIPVSASDIEKANSDHPKATFFSEKWKNGISFYAVGNEPFWSLNITKKNTAEFKTPDGLEFTTFSLSKLASIDPKSTSYRVSNDKGEIIINLVEEKCMDSMADEAFSFKVTVDLKLKGEKSFTKFKGCGDYVPDPRLHGKWIIVKADTLLISKDLVHKQPELNIDIYEGRVSGNDGCNGFNGGIQFRENEIIFGMMASTMMACPNMDISSVITSSFVNKKLIFKFNNQLVFLEGEKEVLLLKRADK